jgi:hypothetical protein
MSSLVDLRWVWGRHFSERQPIAVGAHSVAGAERNSLASSKFAQLCSGSGFYQDFPGGRGWNDQGTFKR